MAAVTVPLPVPPAPVVTVVAGATVTPTPAPRPSLMGAGWDCRSWPGLTRCLYVRGTGVRWSQEVRAAHPAVVGQRAIYSDRCEFITLELWDYATFHAFTATIAAKEAAR